jgi:hypothetical protein
MSDSFADLWNSAAPSKPTQATQPRTLGSIAPTVQPQRRPQTDAFSMLAASSSASTRSTTPSYLSSPPLVKAGSTGGTAAVGGVKPVQKANSSSGDAFSDLFSGSSTASSNLANLTMAQRAALADKKRVEQQSQAQNRPAASKVADAWAGLDSLGTSGFSIGRTASTTPNPPPAQDDWVFDSILTASPAPSVSKPQKAAKSDDDWGLDDFVSKPAPKQPPQTATQSLWDIADFSDGAGRNITSPAANIGRSSTPGSFDFGEREDGLLDDHSGDEDDILGALGKPAQPKPSPSVCTSFVLYNRLFYTMLACSSHETGPFSTTNIIDSTVACCFPSSAYPRANC